MKILFEDNECEFNELTGALFTEKRISVTIARLDKIHPVVSGNKLFKLHYFLQEAIQTGTSTILTFGGAYSNHLAATAYACRSIGIHCIGIIRGEEPAVPSHTLKQCREDGMELHFISREAYAGKDNAAFTEQLQEKFPGCMIIPEGGYHPLGANGAALILDKLRHKQATHICTAAGTATTLAGLLMNSTTQKIIAIPVLKGMNDLQERISFLCNKHYNNLLVFDDYHFGGYAKKTKELISFMNSFFLEYKIPTDFVYTGKMMYAVIDKIKSGYFEAGSHIICLHTGGLQGNDSLPASTLVF